VNLLCAGLVLDLELAVVDVFLAVVAVAVICLLLLLEGDLRVQLGSKFLSSGICDGTISKEPDVMRDGETNLDSGSERWRSGRQFLRRQRQECAGADERRSRSGERHRGGFDERVGAETAC
jgi:hypothetical protein